MPPVSRRALVLGTAALVGSGCAAQSLRRDGAALAGTLRTTLGAVTFDARCPQKGVLDPRCVLVAWSDLECPACAMLARDVDDLLAEKLPVRFVFKHYPLAMHRRSRPYAAVAQSVWLGLGADAFWRVHDALIQQQPEKRELDAWLAAIGVDGATAGRFEAQAYKDVEEHAQQARALGITATPLLIVADHAIPGRVPYEVLRNVVSSTMQ